MFNKMNLIIKQVIEYLFVNDCDYGLYVVRILNTNENYAFNVVVIYDFDICGSFVNDTIKLIDSDNGEYTGNYQLLDVWSLQDVKG